jgi:hypothetical protein
MDPRKPCPTDLNDYAWDLITHLSPEAPRGGRPEKCPTREILNSIFSIVHGWHGGCSRTISHLGRLSIMTSDSGSGTAPGSYQARLQRLTREVTQITGQIATTRASIERLEYELERRDVRAPNEVRDGQVRVELAVRSDAVPSSLLQHGLPGTIEIVVDHVSPAALILCTAGLPLTVPGTSRAFQGSRG